jgi:hypothetical protein
MAAAVKRGFYPRLPRAMLYDRADTLYLQAVRQELEERYSRLEEKLRMRPNEFTDEDRADLERVVQLQTDMVGWTEMDLALRLEDNETKKARIATVAYQIQPLGRLRPQVEASLADEEQQLQDWRSRLELQKDYFSAKSRLQRELREWERSSADDERVGLSEEVIRVQRALKELDEDWQSRKDSLPEEDRAALTEAMIASSDWSATTQLAKSLDIQLGRVEGRQRFLKELATLKTEVGDSIGLNRQYPWLKLPMLMPGANRWASSYHLMTGLQTGHLLLLLVFLLFVLMARSPASIEVRLWRAMLFSQFALAAWCLVFGVVHLV